MSDIRDEWLAYGRERARPSDRPDNEKHWSTEFDCIPRDLLKVPVTHRDEWLDDQRANPPWGSFSPLRHDRWLERGWMLFSTSGTSAAAPRMFRHTTFDRDLWAWLGARALHAMGVKRGDIALNCFGYGTSVAFWGLHYALNLMGVPVIPGGGSNTERRVSFLQNFKPTVLLCTLSYALHLGRTAMELGHDPATSSVKQVVVAGEIGASIMSTKARIEELWGATVHDDFGCTEVAMSPMGYTCAYQAARKDRVDPHLMEDAYRVEVLDPRTWTPVPSGERGLKGLLGIEVKVKCLPPSTLPRTEAKAKRLFDSR